MVKHLLILIMLAATSAPVRADVGVVVAGEATMQPLLVRQLEGWLKQHGHTLVADPLPADAINTLTDCFVIEDEACARGVLEKRGRAKSILFARVELQAGGDINKTMTVTAYWFENGQKAASARRFCERCNEASLQTTTDDMMTQLIKQTPQSAGTLKLTSSPSGATCTIDGKPAGQTPLERELPPGDHEVLVTRADHQREKRTFAIKPNEATTIDIAMVPDERRRPTLPLVAIGTGVAMIATGGVLLAIDKDKGPDQPEFIRDTAPWGVGIGLAGVLAVGGGVLWYRAETKRESHPVATVGRDGGYIGWAGRF